MSIPNNEEEISTPESEALKEVSGITTLFLEPVNAI